MSLKLTNYHRLLLGIAGVLLACIIAIFIIDVREQELIIAEKKGEIKRLKEYQQELQKKFFDEIDVRKNLRYNDSITIAHLKVIKRRDSLEQVKAIKVLIKDIKKLSDKELDQELLKAYEESINSGRFDPHFLP